MMMYDYSSGRVSLDFHLRKSGGLCREFGEIPKRIGGHACSMCKLNKGERQDFVMCGVNGIKDDPESHWVRSELCAELQREALAALCY